MEKLQPFVVTNRSTWMYDTYLTMYCVPMTVYDKWAEGEYVFDEDEEIFTPVSDIRDQWKSSGNWDDRWDNPNDEDALDEAHMSFEDVAAENCLFSADKYYDNYEDSNVFFISLDNDKLMLFGFVEDDSE